MYASDKLSSETMKTFQIKNRSDQKDLRNGWSHSFVTEFITPAYRDSYNSRCWGLFGFLYPRADTSVWG
jgi:hypothetical protein